MAEDLSGSVVRVIDQRGRSAGTGFAAGVEGLVVTCAHVVVDAQSGPDQEVRLGLGDQTLTGLVMPEHWRAPESDDIAVIRVEPWPAGLRPLPLSSSEGASGADYETWGFPDASPTYGLRGTGVVSGPTRDPVTGRGVLQLERSGSVTTGYSGGPVVDLTTRRVVGMVHSISRVDRYGRQAEIALATPSEALRDACSMLRLLDLCPYRSLSVFEERHARFMFGRETFVGRMLDQLRRQPLFLAVLGPSGSGKSSAVRAGLLAEIAAGRVPRLRGYARVVTRPAELTQRLAGDYDDLLGALGLADEPVVLVIDQFEEVFLETAQWRTRLIERLCSLLDGDSQASVIIVMRDDFYSRLAVEATELIRWVERGLANIPAKLTEQELTAIVREPAHAVRLRFEEGLVDAIVADAIEASVGGRYDEPGRPAGAGGAQSTVLPLLEFTLTQLWNQRSDGMLRWRPYRDGNGVSGALTSWADAAVRDLPPHLLDTARSLFTSLVHLGDETTGMLDSRRKRLISQLYQNPAQRTRLDAVLVVMTARRLLVTAADGPGGAETVELIHDVLLREWRQLVDWLAEDREFLTWRQWLEPWAEAWQADPGLTGRLLRGADLTTARRYLVERHDDLSPAARALIEQSIGEWEREQRERAEIQRTLDEHLRVTIEAEIRARAVGVGRLIELEPAPGLVQAVSLTADNLARLPETEPLSQVRAVLRLATQRSREMLVLGTGAAVRAVAYAPDGWVVATGGDDRLIRLWEPDGRPLIDPIVWHKDSVNVLAFAPGGEVLASGGEDGLIALWSRSGRLLESRQSGAAVLALAWSADGRLAGADEAGHLFLGESALPNPATEPAVALACAPRAPWLVIGTLGGSLHVLDQLDGTPEPHSVHGAHNGLIAAVAIHPEGRLLASAGIGGVIRMWSWEGGRLEPVGLPWQAHVDTVRALAFSADGDFLVSAAADGASGSVGGGAYGTVRLWDVGTRRAASDPLIGHEGPVIAVAISPDGTRLVSGGTDRTARVWSWGYEDRPLEPPRFDYGESLFGSGRWDAHGMQVLAAQRRHREYIYRVALSADGQWVATGSDDRTVVVSRLDGSFMADPFTGHTSQVVSVSFSPDGRTIASADADGVVRLWDRQGNPVGRPLEHSAPVRTVGYSAVGGLLATGDASGLVTVFDAESRQVLQLLRHRVPVTELVFHPSGQQLYSAGEDGVIQVWTVDGEPAGPPFVGHDGQVRALAVSADGTLLATGGDDNLIRIWDSAAQPVGQPFIGHEGDLLDVSFTPDGMLLSASRDRTVRLWALDGTQLGDPLEGHAEWVTSVVATPDGRYAISTGADATMRIWQLGGWRAWLTHACRLLTHHPLLAAPMNKDVREYCARIGEERPRAAPGLAEPGKPTGPRPSPG